MIALPAAAVAAMKSQLFAGGAMLAIMGSAIAWGRAIPVRMYQFVKRRFVVQVDIVSTDPLFFWFSRWLDSQPQIKKSRLLTASSDRDPPRSVGAPSVHSDDEDPPPNILFAPAPGQHFFWLKGRPMMLTRERKDVPAGKRGEWGGFQETFVLRTFGRSSATLRGMLEDARDMSYDGSRRVEVYGMRYGDWRTLTDISPRQLSTVFLADGQLERIVKDLEDFLQLEEWYAERGIPWRRGHMYEGPPGTGKSSMVAALAGHLKLNLYICSINDRTMTDERLLSCLQEMRPRSILLLEDIDALVEERDVAGEATGVTFAGLLNALDGVTSKSGIITIMTTNHPEKLDPALVRKGRVDLRENFGVATYEQGQRLVRHFYRDAITDEQVNEFAVAGVGLAMSTLQGALLDNKYDPAGAIRDLFKASLEVAA